MYKNALVFVGLITSSASFAGSLPDRITCTRSDSAYALVLILDDAKLPPGQTVIGLKNGDAVVFKVASQTYRDESRPPNYTLNFSEFPASETSKLVKLTLSTKKAELFHFSNADLKDGSVFDCKF